MPFTSDTAKTAGSKGGKKGSNARWAGKAPDTYRNIQVKIAVSASELEMLNNVAAELGLTRVELILRAVAAYSQRQSQAVMGTDDV